MKKCFKCNEVKSLECFYKHSAMSDGHLNKCIDCTKKDVREREVLLIETDPEYRLKERIRGRNKYRRLYIGITRSKDIVRAANENYKSNYPEKRAAISLSASIKCPSGFHKHHWSYNEEHFKDVIIISSADHVKIHRYMRYDQAEKKYRTTEGTLLETRDMHEKYISLIKELF